MAKESAKDAALRWKKLELLQEHYRDFDTLLYDVIENFMGFDCTDIQQDIGDFLANGPTRAMIQAQRGQAKTTITSIYAVWRQIHDPSTRILIMSAGGPLAKEIANWIIQIIMGMDELECMRPDSSNGDRESVEAFDIHYSLKGPEKSPSIACVGVTSNIQGKRADLLIADDIESSKNSATEIQRDKLRQLTRDFTSICSKGKIVYLGTPQSIDSVYNGLPSRGYEVRVWPGRYPTEEEELNYGNALAPLIQDRMSKNPLLRSGGGSDGTRGKPIDPVLLGEDELLKKEVDQGKAYFQLQHMLDTKLMDADRYPLKPEGLIFMNVPSDRVPLSVNILQSSEYKIHTPQDFPIESDFYEICGHSDEWAEFTGTHMYVDPSGGGKNGDELAWAVTKFRSGNIYIVDIGGVPGGLNEKNQNLIADLAWYWKVAQIDFEDNFGAGTFREVITPRILKKFEGSGKACGIEGVWESGQKELRIIDIMEPLIGGGRLIIDKQLIQKDWQQCSRYGAELRGTYSFFFQLARLTRDKKCLAHDDRLDAVAGSCRHWNDLLSIDKNKEIAKAKNEAYRKMMQDPMGDGSNLMLDKHKKHNTIFDRFRR
jgi:hypothetical protein